MEYFAGLDVSLRSCALCIVDNRGDVLFERELPCEVGDIAECLRAFSHPIERVGFEAGTMSQHLFFGLTGEGFDVVCMKARYDKAYDELDENCTNSGWIVEPCQRQGLRLPFWKLLESRIKIGLWELTFS